MLWGEKIYCVCVYSGAFWMMFMLLLVEELLQLGILSGSVSVSYILAVKSEKKYLYIIIATERSNSLILYIMIIIT